MLHTKNDSAALRYSIGTIGLLGSGVLLAVSALMNYRFGYTLGRTPEDGHIYGMAAMAADSLKACVPFIIFAAWRSRVMPVFWGSLVVWMVMLTFGLAGAAGHAALNRLDTASNRVGAATSYQDARTELKSARLDRGFIPPHRPEATVRAEMEKHKTNRAWTQSSECSEATGKSQRDYCSQYHTLNAELGYAMQAAKLDARIEKLTAKSDQIGSHGGVQSEADPQASVLSKLTTLDIPTTQIVLILLIVAVLEVGGGFGPYVSLSYIFPRKPHEELEQKAEAPALAGTEVVTALEPVPEPKALPAPLIPELPAVRVSAPDPIPALEPETIAIPPRLILLPGADLWLASMNFALKPPRSGELGEWPSHTQAAKCFACWLRAYGLEGPYSHNQIVDLWGRCCTAYHKQQLIWNQFKGSLEKVRGVEWKKVRLDGKETPRPMRWFISTPEAIAADIKRFAKSAPDPKQEAAPDPGHRPLASLPVAAANDNRKRAVPAWIELQTIESRQMKFMATQNSMRSRKQRGSRVNRMARAA